MNNTPTHVANSRCSLSQKFCPPCFFHILCGLYCIGRFLKKIATYIWKNVSFQWVRLVVGEFPHRTN